MRDSEFSALQASLLRNGVQPRYARRVVEELRAHTEDLREEYLAAGFDGAEADRRAAASIGRFDDLAAEISARRELKTWAYRYPYAAIVIYPLACLVSLPAAPVLVGLANAPSVVRWGASLLAAATFTCVLFLLLQVSILLG